MICLESSDIFLFRDVLKGDIRRLFESEETFIFPSNCVADFLTPSAAEKAAQALSGNLGLKDPDTGFVFLPMIWEGKSLGITVFRDAEDKCHWLGQWTALNQLILEKIWFYKETLTDQETGLLGQRCLEDFIVSFLQDSSRVQVRHELVLERASDLCLIFVELKFDGSEENSTQSSGHMQGLCKDFWTRAIPAIRNSLTPHDYSYLFRMEEDTLGILIPYCPMDMGQGASVSITKTLRKTLDLEGKAKKKGGMRFSVGLAAYPFGDSNADDAGGALLPEELYAKIIEHAKESLCLARSRPDYPVASWIELKKVDSLKMAKDVCKAAEQVKVLWGKVNKFSLILSRFDHTLTQDRHELVSAEIRSFLTGGQEMITCSEDTYLFYLPEMGPEEALHRGRKLQDLIKGKSGQSVSMGLASYPTLNYSKEDIPFNAHKALIHTAFFGPDTATSFGAVSLNISGDMLFNAGFIDGAILEYKKGLSLESDNVNLLNSLGVCYAQMKWYKRAINCFEQALAVGQNDVMAHHNLASAFLKSGFVDKAFLVLQRAVALDGDHFDILFQLGRLMQEKKRLRDAADCFEKATRCAGAKGFAHRYLGEVYLDLHLKEESMAEFKKAVKTNPADASSLSHLGRLYAELRGDFEISDALCNKALELDPKSKLAWKTLGWIHYQRQDYDKAAYYLKEAEERSKDDHEIYYHLGLAYEKMDKINEAKRSWKRAIKVNPSCKEAWEALQSAEGKAQS